VKVVQRIPMRVRVDTSDSDLPPLRAGMSVEVDVDTGHARGLPRFLTSLLGSGAPACPGQRSCEAPSLISHATSNPKTELFSQPRHRP
jgi:hypothetical protein